VIGPQHVLRHATRHSDVDEYLGSPDVVELDGDGRHVGVGPVGETIHSAGANGIPGSPVSRRTSPQLVEEVLEQDDGVVLCWRFTCRDGERDGEPLAVQGDVEASQAWKAGRPRARLVCAARGRRSWPSPIADRQGLPAAVHVESATPHEITPA
jgi:hypothetical protein